MSLDEQRELARCLAELDEPSPDQQQPPDSPSDLTGAERRMKK
jgi:hypothetical protein